MKDPFISPPIKVYDRTIEERNHEIYVILSDLTDEEKGRAMHEYARMKWYRIRHAEYWAEQENKKK